MYFIISFSKVYLNLDGMGEWNTSVLHRALLKSATHSYFSICHTKSLRGWEIDMVLCGWGQWIFHSLKFETIRIIFWIPQTFCPYVQSEWPETKNLLYPNDVMHLRVVGWGYKVLVGKTSIFKWQRGRGQIWNSFGDVTYECSLNLLTQ